MPTTLLVDHSPETMAAAPGGVPACGVPRWGSGRRAAPRVVAAAELSHAPQSVLRRARAGTLLVADGEATQALEPWARWREDRGLLAGLRTLAESGPRPGETASRLADLPRTAAARPDVPGSWPLRACTAPGPGAGWDGVRRLADAGHSVVLRWWGVPLAVMEDSATLLRHAELTDHVRDVVRVLTWRRLAERYAVPPAEWVALGPYPWLAGLSGAAVGEFADEMVAVLLTCARSGDPAVARTTLNAWQSSCETRLDAGLAAAFADAPRAARGSDEAL